MGGGSSARSCPGTGFASKQQILARTDRCLPATNQMRSPPPQPIEMTMPMRISMLMSMSRRMLAVLALLCLTVTAASAQTRDAAGSRDYPGIGRVAGSIITGYVMKDFDAVRMQAAAFRDGQPVDARRLEGRVFRIAYRTNPGPSILEVSRNFETQLAKAGFETLLACDTDDCGGIPFTEAIDRPPVPQMWVDGFNYRYYAGRKMEAGREIWASVIVSKNNDNIHAQLTVAEAGAIENKMIDAAA